MDECNGLYDNLSPCKFPPDVSQMKAKVEMLEQEVKQLETALKKSELDKINIVTNCERLRKNNVDLLANLSALFMTAKKEMKRKDDMIKELNQQLDDVVLRRNKRQWSPQKSYEDRKRDRKRDDPAYKSNADNKRRSPADAVDRRSNEDRRYDDSQFVKSIVNRKSHTNTGFSDRNSAEDSRTDRKRESPSNHDLADRWSSRDRKRDNPAYSRSSSDQRHRSPSDPGGRKSKEHRRKKKHDRASPPDLEFSSRRYNEDRLRDDPAYLKLTRDQIRRYQADPVGRSSSNPESSGKEDRKKEDPAFWQTVKRESPANSEFADRIRDWPKEDLVISKSIENRKSLVIPDLGYRIPPVEDPKRKDPAPPLNIYQKRKCLSNAEFCGRKSTEDEKVEPALPKVSENRKRESPVNPELGEKKSFEDSKRKDLVDLKKSIIVPRKIGSAELGGGRSTEDSRKEDPTDSKPVQSKKTIEKKEDPVVVKSIIVPKKDPTNSEKSTDARKPVDPIPKPSAERSAKSSHPNRVHPEGRIEVIDILRQYGVYATPHKLSNGAKYIPAKLKLVSPIADTPDHLKALFNDPKIKVSPIPMLNERRGLDAFSSPVKEPAASSLESNQSGDSTDTGATVVVSGTDSCNAEHGVFKRKKRAAATREAKRVKL